MSKKTIFWAGDSTVANNKIRSYPQTGIGQVFDLFLKEEVSIANYALNGRSTKSFIEQGWLDQIADRITQTDFLFMQFGHNDEKIEDPLRYTRPSVEYKDNLKIMIEVARKNKACPLLITPLYRRIFMEDGTLMWGGHEAYQEAMIALAKEEGVASVDLCQKSKELYQKVGDEGTKKWFMHIKPQIYRLYQEGLADDTHLNHEGAVQMSFLLADGLRACGGVFSDLLSNEDNIYV